MKRVGFFICLIICVALSLPAQASNVLVIGTGNVNGNAALNVLTLAPFNHSLTFGPNYWEFDGTQSLAGYDVVLLLSNYAWTANMPEAGQNGLMTYVTNGGGLVVSEWALWKGSGFDPLRAAFAATSDSTYNHATPTTYTKEVADPTINFGMPDSFTFALTDLSGTESRISVKAGAQEFYKTSNFGGTYTGLAGWDYGSGRVANFSTLIAQNEMADANYQQLVSNVINWADGQAVIPIPGAVWLLGSGLAGLAALRRWRR